MSGHNKVCVENVWGQTSFRWTCHFTFGNDGYYDLLVLYVFN